MCITWLMAVQYCLESESDNQVAFFKVLWVGWVRVGVSRLSSEVN